MKRFFVSRTGQTKIEVRIFRNVMHAGADHQYATRCGLSLEEGRWGEILDALRRSGATSEISATDS